MRIDHRVNSVAPISRRIRVYCVVFVRMKVDIRMYYFPRPNVWGVSTSRSPRARAWLLHVKFRESSLENKYTARTDSRVLSPRRRRDISRC